MRHTRIFSQRMYNINITSKQTKLNKPKLNTAYGDGPKVDETALLTMALPRFSKLS